MIRIATLAVLTIAAAVPAASARPADAASCSVTASPGNVQARIDAAGAGQTVCLEAGVYRGPVVVYGKSGVTISGAGKFLTIISGPVDNGIVILNSSGVTVEHLTLYAGNPANVYIGHSTDVTLRGLDIGAGNIGVHVDDGSTAAFSDSFLYAMGGDGVLIRRGSGALIERNWIFYNGGVGVSAIGNTGTTSLVRNIISDNGGAGIFAGVPPCAGLPGASLAVPPCFLQNPGAFVASAQLVLDTNVVQASGSTGIVLFPGTRATMTGNRVWRNAWSGLFVWGADITSSRDEYDGNDENAIEVRAYPAPRYGGAGYRGATARIEHVEIRNTRVFALTGTLGGGLVAHDAYVELINSRVYWNAGQGISYQNGATGRIEGNAVFENGGAGICFYGAGAVYTNANFVVNNPRNEIGAC